jgi:hypothetical protein
VKVGMRRAQNRTTRTPRIAIIVQVWDVDETIFVLVLTILIWRTKYQEGIAI